MAKTKPSEAVMRETVPFEEQEQAAQLAQVRSALGVLVSFVHSEAEDEVVLEAARLVMKLAGLELACEPQEEAYLH